MKLHLLLLCSFITLVTACSSPDSSTSRNGNDGTISETALPKGKLIVEEETRPVNTPVNNGGSINGYDSNNGENKTTDIANIPQDKKENLKRRFKNALVFHADDTMKINKAYIATLVLGKDQILGNLKADAVDGNTNVSDNEIKMDTTLEIGTKMRATLVDLGVDEKKGFTIEFLGRPGSEEQKISEKRKKATWQWKLTPLTPGLQELKLSISLIEKDDEVVNLPVRNIPVVIFAEKESFLDMVGGWFKGENVKWMLSVILIPIFIAWLTSRIKYKHDSNRRSEAAKNAVNTQGGNNNSQQTTPSSQPIQPPQTFQDND
jgi:hypothetical protein